MTDYRIIDWKRYCEEMSTIVDRMKVDFKTCELIDSIVKKCIRGVYIKK